MAEVQILQEQISAMPSLAIVATGFLPLATYMPSLAIVAAGFLPLATYMPSLAIKKAHRIGGQK